MRISFEPFAAHVPSTGCPTDAESSSRRRVICPSGYRLRGSVASSSASSSAKPVGERDRALVRVQARGDGELRGDVRRDVAQPGAGRGGRTSRLRSVTSRVHRCGVADQPLAPRDRGRLGSQIAPPIAASSRRPIARSRSRPRAGRRRTGPSPRSAGRGWTRRRSRRTAPPTTGRGTPRRSCGRSRGTRRDRRARAAGARARGRRRPRAACARSRTSTTRACPSASSTISRLPARAATRHPTPRRPSRRRPASVVMRNVRASRIVLGLRDQVQRCERRIDGGVRHDRELARSREPVDPDDAGDLSLGLGDVGVARPHDPIDRRDRRRPERQAPRPPGRRPTSRRSSRRPSGRVQHRRRDRAVGLRRRAEHDPLDARDHRRDDRHADRRGVDGPASRHVATDAGERSDDLAESHPVALVPPLRGKLTAMEVVQAQDQRVEGRAEFLRRLGRGAGRTPRR